VGLPDNVGPPLVDLAQHVEQEEVHVEVQRLVVQEQLCQVGQVLAVGLLGLAVHLKHADVAVAVHLVTWGGGGSKSQQGSQESQQVWVWLGATGAGLRLVAL